MTMKRPICTMAPANHVEEGKEYRFHDCGHEFSGWVEWRESGQDIYCPDCGTLHAIFAEIDPFSESVTDWRDRITSEPFKAILQKRGWLNVK